ncbi:hypothetical protein KP509_30G008800 [Ceratopteris richardii]|uniref:Dynein assembly factor 1, axonemal homolog n=1 Tax=Ceratopteris richardii TaxID=49495 RepID=A0A8T2QZL9_CERRI|nr:hypothetical protein KP509_30G008800 [Ceratopteris richardii]
MGFDMNPQSLKKLCRELKLYSSAPELNDVLYLQQKGIVKLKHLDAYTGLKSLHLECNAISDIEGLDDCVNISCLYLNQNIIEDIKGLENLKLLETINLADNQIRRIQGLAGCPLLRQLNVSGNYIRTEDDVSHLLECKNLLSLDISNNKIDDEDALKIIKKLSLSLLRMNGNPVVSKTRYYRKSIINSIPMLNYLDDSPVFAKERRLAEAWEKGGIEAEKDMRETIKKEEALERESHRKGDCFIQMHVSK